MKIPVVLAFALAAATAPFAQAQESQSIEQAKAAATVWLALVDAGNYSASWQQASGLFRSAVTPESWASAVRAARSPLGALRSRTVQSASFSRTLPGAPEGEYVVIKYTSSFANMANAAVETVTPSKEKDGSWHVSGYYVR
jgi:hypothetical protein